MPLNGSTISGKTGAYALLGPSGCGKTTLLNIISGLLKPSWGRVKFGETDVTDLPPEKRNIAQVFQFPVLYDTMTVYENLAFPLKNRGVPAADIDKRVKEIAQALELTQDLGKRAAGLSADAKQKISLGRGLVRSDVAAILFDEPLTVIDPHLKWDLRRKLKEIHKKFNLTMIYVTHDQVEAMTFADKIVVMYEGEIVQMGTPEELFEEPEHTFVGYFIGSPGMNFLECTVADGVATVDGGTIQLTPSYADKAQKMGGKLKIGIRPMYVGVHETEVEEGIAAEVLGVEDQGFCKIVTVGFGNSTVKARIKDNRTISDGKCWLTFPQDKTKLYSDERLVR